ncbi:MAG: 2-C-methyl-D-erythritol 4-phosphate cytidylyltransferase [Desulfatibacillaceae bacterium]|nr:2-C-methyl-D-erythritol 4-phosphate cytidylyltransferase [Desulfatibacillaceae bacterium]
MICAVIVAAGSGERMQSKEKKQFADLGGRPVIIATLEAFLVHPQIERIVLVTAEADLPKVRSLLAQICPASKPIRLVRGGATRQESVQKGLAASGADTTIVLIHDGVRPLVNAADISACIEGAKEHGACIAAVPAFDTIKQANEDGLASTTLDRQRIWLAQTPQAFDYNLICKAHEQAAQNGFVGTDDAALVEKMGKAAMLWPCSRYNIKITTRQDLEAVRAIHASRMKP